MVFLYPQSEINMLYTNKNILKILKFTDPKFFQSSEISGVGQVVTNKYLRMA